MLKNNLTSLAMYAKLLTRSHIDIIPHYFMTETATILIINLTDKHIYLLPLLDEVSTITKTNKIYQR